MGEPGFKLSSDWQSHCIPTESTRSLARKTRHRINHICTHEISHIDTDGNWAQCTAPAVWDAEPSEARVRVGRSVAGGGGDGVGDTQSSPPLPT